MGWLIYLVHAHWIVRGLVLVGALIGIAWSLRRMWQLHAATLRQRQDEATQRRQARIRSRSARQAVATPTPTPTPAPEEPQQEDLLSVLASQETGRMPVMDLGHAETRRLGATPPPSVTEEDEAPSPTDRDTRYPIDGGAVTRRDLRPPAKDASTQILREVPPQGIDANLQAAIRGAVEDSLREEGSDTLFKDFADTDHAEEPADSTTTDVDEDEADQDIGAETTNRMTPVDTDAAEGDVGLVDSEDDSEPGPDDEQLPDSAADDQDDDLEARRRRRRVSQEIIHHNAQRHEELGLHIGISPDGPSEAEVSISAADKQQRLRQLGLADDDGDEVTLSAPASDVMARVEAAIAAMGGDEEDAVPASSDNAAPSDDDQNEAEQEDGEPGEALVRADEPSVSEAPPATPALSVPEWARADTFDEDMDDEEGDAPRQHHLFD